MTSRHTITSTTSWRHLTQLRQRHSDVTSHNYVNDIMTSYQYVTGRQRPMTYIVIMTTSEKLVSQFVGPESLVDPLGCVPLYVVVSWAELEVVNSLVVSVVAASEVATSVDVTGSAVEPCVDETPSCDDVRPKRTETRTQQTRTRTEVETLAMSSHK